MDDVAAELGVPADALEAWRGAALEALSRVVDGARTDAPGDVIPAAVGPTAAPVPMFLHHVGIVARDAGQMERIAGTLGLQEVARDHLSKYRVTNVFYAPPGAAAPAGQVQFMLPDGGILANFNGGKGGLHHLCFCVPDLEAAMLHLGAHGVRFIARVPQEGINGFRFNFALPGIEGINIELIEDPAVDWGHRRRPAAPAVLVERPT